MNKYREEIYELRAQVLKTIAAHEEAVHGGEVCKLERVNLVAFICHSLQLTSEDFDAIKFALASYDHTHEQQKGAQVHD